MTKHKRETTIGTPDAIQVSSARLAWWATGAALLGVIVSAVFAWQANSTAHKALVQSQEASVLATRPRVSLCLVPIGPSNIYCVASVQNNTIVFQYAIKYRNAGNSTAVGLDSPADMRWKGEKLVGDKQEPNNISLIPGEEITSPKAVLFDKVDPSRINTLVQQVNEGVAVLKMEFALQYSPESDRSKRYRTKIRFEISRNRVVYTTKEYD